MFLRITRASIEPAKASQVASLAQDVVDAVTKLPGCKQVYQAGDASSGQTAIVSLWDTKEHAQFDRAALGDTMRRIQATGVKLEAPEIYEVNAQS